MPNIGWDEASPTDSESAGLGDDRIRSLKTSLRMGLDAEHNWPSASGDAGAHRLGSARPYVGTQSQVSSSGTDGRLMYASDTSQLFHVGSAGTCLLGGNKVIQASAYPGVAPQRHYWAEEWGGAILNSDGSVTVTIPDSGYSGIPYVLHSQYTTGATITGVIPYLLNLSPTAFMLYNNLGSSGSGAVILWRSVGSRVL